MNDIFLLFFRKKALIHAFHLVAQKEKPVLVTVEAVDIRSIVADGIESTHDGTDTGSGNTIYRNISLFRTLSTPTSAAPLAPSLSTQHEPHSSAVAAGLRE